jgi:uncharacterized protein (TIGR02594 family)
MNIKDYSIEPTFSAAFSVALKELGADKIFIYKGKQYKTELAEKKDKVLADYIRPFIGQKEVKGTQSNSFILKIINKFFPDWLDDSTISWCSMIMKYIFEKEGYQVSKATPAARSWLNVGTSLSTPIPEDCIVVIKRGSQEWQGHVGIFMKEEGTYIWILGGNQSDSVSIQKFPKSSVLGYRKISK